MELLLKFNRLRGNVLPANYQYAPGFNGFKDGRDYWLFFLIT
ncbi:MAG: hypothetical protein WD824_13530 [Cyclobacteriaceae bacterium]